jgi:hypothetical protein|tara:strand:+ start:4218 stop:5375 length:1158 start_codon:yes stop_codon:yes gene_type:complete
MKSKFLCIALFASISLWAQKPQAILGIAKENKSTEYYKEQYGLWKKEAQENPKDANAWYQTYKAHRAYLQKSQAQDWLKNQSVIYSKLRETIDASKKHIGSSYEYYVMEGMNCRGSKSAHFSQKAFDINPKRTETHEGLLVYYISTFEAEKANKIAKVMMMNNHFSNSNLKWNYNSLQTAENNGVIITHGDLDAIPKWVLQYGAGIRTDVLVVNKWLLSDDDKYRAEVFKRLGIKDLDKKQKDYKDAVFYINDLMAHVLKNSKSPAYIGCGTDISFFKEYGIEDKMYLVGTCFRYSENNVDNLALVIKNFEQVYDLEYLFNNFQIHPDDIMIKMYLNVTYIPGLMKLKKHYELTNDLSKVNKCNKLIDKIAEDSGRKEEIMGWYK